MLYVNYILFGVEYIDRYWAERLIHELNHIVPIRYDETYSSPEIDGKTVSVFCRTWDALFDLDVLIMKAGYGYSLYKQQ